jgi:hypothetical protein
MKTTAFTITFLLSIITGFAQDSITVTKDARLDILTAKQIQINKRSAMMTSTGLYKGFRLQVLITTNRNDAFSMKSNMLGKFSDSKCYIVFQSPYFKVRLGNFVQREDAEKFRKQNAKLLPQSGAYIVEDIIDNTSIDEIADPTLN